jgi:DUF4097 and DUF4098 domain-containing protein YvlB
MRALSPAASVVAASVIAAVTMALPHAQQAADVTTVPFSDPARIGTIRVAMHSGGITIRGGNRRDVVVTSRGDEDRPRRNTPAPPGLTRLNQPTRLVITEENNQIAIQGGTNNRPGDVEVQVPTRVNLNLAAHNNGDILVENTDGDMEVTNHNGAIRLANVAGSVVANTHNGDVKVTLTRITSEKAMAFASFNGDVDVTLPANAKANLKLRSDNGEIFTDFEIQMRPSTPAQSSRSSGGPTRIEVNQSIYGTINGGGPEFELRTYNGNIFVRKAAQ